MITLATYHHQRQQQLQQYHTIQEMMKEIIKSSHRVSTVYKLKGNQPKSLFFVTPNYTTTHISHNKHTMSDSLIGFNTKCVCFLFFVMFHVYILYMVCVLVCVSCVCFICFCAYVCFVCCVFVVARVVVCA